MAEPISQYLTADGLPRCIALRLSGQCEKQTGLLRLCHEHVKRQQQLIKAGKSLVYITDNFDIGLERVVEP